MISKAILSINPNAKVGIEGTDIDTCIFNWDSETTPILREDIKSKIEELKVQEEQDKINIETKKASGKQKLKDLGLDDDEIQALIGV